MIFLKHYLNNTKLTSKLKKKNTKQRIKTNGKESSCVYERHRKTKSISAQSIEQKKFKKKPKYAKCLKDK